MTTREKRLAVTVGTVGGVLLLWRVVLPGINDYVFAVAVENERLEERLAEMEERYGDVEKPRRRYAEYVARTGGFDAGKVRNELQAKLLALVERHKFSDVRLTPKNSGDYRPPGSKKRTGIKVVGFSLTAEAKLDAIVRFLESFYELPYVARISTIKIDPPSGRSAGNKSGPVKLRASIEALVPPEHDVADVNEALLKQPAKHVKHAGRTYASIWKRKPFDEYVPPPAPRKPVPKPPPRVVKKPEPAPPSPPKPVGDPDRERKVIPMTLDYGIKEVMVVNSRNNTTEYVGLGAQLDGGTVQLIHPLGAVTRRESGEEFLYPVGKRLVEAVPFEETLAMYPEVYYEFRDASEEFKRKKAAAANRANKKKDETGVKPDQGNGGKKSAPGVTRKGSTPAATRGDQRRPSPGANRGRAGPRRGGKPVTGPRAGGNRKGQPASAAEKKSENSGG